MPAELPADDATLARTPEETPTVVVTADAPVASPLQLTPGTMLGGRYRIVSMLGRGGMGEVYRADDLRMGQPVALKFLSARIASERTRLYDEVRMGRQIAHPNVCRLYDVSEVDGQAFISMELVVGEDLASLFRRIGRLPATKAIATAREIAGGLAAAHERGVVHRDLKPGNVMIDDRGRARITDFGLAVAEESANAHSLAGTPAYMAPEQLDGNPASFASDVYALGLVLYELFTGRRAYSSSSMTQLVEAQRLRSYARPSTLAPDVPVAVEQVIAHCLEPDPARRPTIDGVLRELPSFDALEAALAAGETPGPDLVAAAENRGLSAPIAWTLLLFVLGGIAAAALLSGTTMLYRRLPQFKSPEVLADRAREVLAAVSAVPAKDSAYGFINIEGTLRFRYRQSPAPMYGRTAEHIVLLEDPPLTLPGMATVLVDGGGRLRRLGIVPPDHEAAKGGAPADFAPLLAFAGFSGTGLVPAAPQWTAPVDSDEKRAWLAPDGTRIEAAAFHAKPVWLTVIAPTVAAEPRSSRSLKFPTILVFFLIALPIAALLLARRNIRRGQGDRRSALRLAAFAFLVEWLAGFARAHHPPSFFDEWGMLSQITADSFFIAFMIAVAYIAIEPLVRRRWPRMLISSTRLLAGAWRDPMVGRDLLAGATCGIAIALAWYATALAPGAAPLLYRVSALGETQQVGYYLTYAIGDAVIRAIGAVTLIVVLRMLLRDDRLTMIAAVVLLAVSNMPDATGPVWARVAYGLIAAVVAVYVLFRFGIVAVIAAVYFVIVLRGVPLTFDPSAWYFGRSLLAMAILVALTVTGFVLALGDRPSLPRFALDD